MKTLTQIALTALIACSALAAQAGPVRGYVRSNGTYVAPHYRSDAGSLGGSHSSGYVYRNPCAAAPAVSVNGYFRSSGTSTRSQRTRECQNACITDCCGAPMQPCRRCKPLKPREVQKPCTQNFRIKEVVRLFQNREL